MHDRMWTPPRGCVASRVAELAVHDLEVVDVERGVAQDGGRRCADSR
jgi:hypothetical protein